MKLLHLAIGTMLLFASTIIASCESGNSRMVKGNWYCDAVNGFRYTNVGHSGKYREVTAMNSDGTCLSSWKNFDGPISPLDEEVRIHQPNIAIEYSHADCIDRFLFISAVPSTSTSLLSILLRIQPKQSVMSPLPKLVATPINNSTTPNWPRRVNSDATSPKWSLLPY